MRPIDVRLGPTDGTKTEVGGSDVKEGLEVIVGENPRATESGLGSKTPTREEAMRRAFDCMGPNTLLVLSGSAGSGVTWGTGSTSTLTPEDADEILSQCPAVQRCGSIVRGRVQFSHGSQNRVSDIMGTTPSYLTTRDWTELSEGDMFSDRDVLNANKVCVIGETLKRVLFAGESPIGKEIRIGNVVFRVIGVLSRKGPNVMGGDQDDIVLAPGPRSSSASRSIGQRCGKRQRQRERIAEQFDQQPQQSVSKLHVSLSIRHRRGRHPAIRPHGDRRQSAREGRLQ